MLSLYVLSTGLVRKEAQDCKLELKRIQDSNLCLEADIARLEGEEQRLATAVKRAESFSRKGGGVGSAVRSNKSQEDDQREVKEYFVECVSQKGVIFEHL